MKAAVALETKSLIESKVIDRILKEFMPNMEKDCFTPEELLPELPESISFPQLEHCVSKYWMKT